MFSRFVEPVQMAAILAAFNVVLLASLLFGFGVFMFYWSPFRGLALGAGLYMSLMVSLLIWGLVTIALGPQATGFSPWYFLMGIPSLSAIGGHGVAWWHEKKEKSG
jgi:hypothetical protein